MVDRSSLTREWTMDAIILAPGAALELIQFYRRRIDELLDTTNRYLERVREALSPILHLIRQFAEDTNERNWADKRIYIKQQAERAIGEITKEIAP